MVGAVSLHVFMGLIPNVAFFDKSKQDLSKEVLASETSFDSFVTSSFEEISSRSIDRDYIRSFSRQVAKS